MSTPRQTLTVAAQEGETFQTGADRLTIKIDGTKTGGLFSLMEREVAGHFQSPPRFHSHTDTDWLCYVLEGRLQFHLDEGTVVCGAGDSVYIPRGRFFRWANPDAAPARCLIFYTPGGFENFFREIIPLVAKKSDELADYSQTLQQIEALQDKYDLVRR